MPFAVEFSDRAREHMNAFRKRDQQIIADSVGVQLISQPDQPTRNRKKLEDNPLAPWQLRVGNFRVFYDVFPAEQQVIVLAVGQKKHNVLWIGGREVQL